jgi:ubiquinone biosynthesis protein
MLKERLIPTPLVLEKERGPIEIAPLRQLGSFRSLTLTLRIFKFLVGLLWAVKVTKKSRAEVAASARGFLEDLGGLWIKAGQILSLRTDLLSREMADELSSLQYRAFGFDPAVARARVEAALGRPVSEVFDVFEEMPFAAASVAQVHRAHLKYEKVWVVVKIQRPDIGIVFKRDLTVIGFLLRLFGRLPALSYVKWDGMIRELDRIVQEEVDYGYEAGNLRRMRKMLRDHKVYVPKVFGRYSSRHVLVMELISGTLMSDYLRVVRSDPARAAQWRTENNVSAYKVGSRLQRSVYRQMFEDNLFHGDLHPGNVILLRDSRFALIDLGSTGSLERKFLSLYQYQTQAFAEGDFSKACDYYLMMADSIPVFEINKFKAEAVEVFRAWEARTHMRGLSYYEKSVTGGVGVEMSAIARKYRVNLSWQFLRVGRALGTMDASLAVLLGNSNPNRIMRKYFHQLRQRSLRKLFSGGLLNMASSTVSDLRQMTGYASDTLRQEAIKFEGMRSTAAYMLGVLFSTIRVGLFIGGAVLVYDFLHQHHFDFLEPVHENIGGFAAVAHVNPSWYPYEIGVAAILGVVVLYWAAGRVKRHLNKEVVRLPGGRLDT